jgi:hypothetical protein
MSRYYLFLLVMLAARPVVATDNYSYKDDEYAIISDGRSPDGRWSIAAHGRGEAGYEDFDLYLMREPAHEKLASLHTGECLDTSPLSIIAVWAPDSKHVAVLNRSDRHVLDLRLFTISGGRAQSIKVPLLLDVVGQQHLNPEVHYQVLSRLYRVAWPQPDQLSLKELDSLRSSATIFREALEPYLTFNDLDAEDRFTNFSASATARIASNDELRLDGVKALPLSDWPKTIVYSLHLRVDPHRGLHNTETTVSSLDAQKDGKYA